MRIMNGQNGENLKDLFERFDNSEQAEEAVEDIRKGERILREHPAPEPNDKLIADIKANLSEAALRRKVNVFRKMVYKTAVAAAAVIILAVVGVRLLEKSGGEAERVTYASKVSEAIWESDDISAADECKWLKVWENSGRLGMAG